MAEAWKECQKPVFAKAHSELCAAAMVAILRPCGNAVRENYWVLVKPPPPPAVAKAAAKLSAQLAVDGYIPYRALLRKAVEEFIKYLNST